MRQYLSPEDIANDIRMTRSQHRGAFVMVEGETADLLFFDRLLDRNECQLQPAFGKANVLDVVSLLEADGFLGILGIVDADRSRISGNRPPSDNVLITDGCDLEAMILHSPALDKVLAELGSTEKIRRFESESGTTVREHLAALARPLGALRHISETEKIGLSFEGLKFARFVDKQSLVLDHTKLVSTVLARSVAPQRTFDQMSILERVDRIVADRGIPAKNLSNGHDMVEILSLGLRQVLGSRREIEITPEILERDLRLAYEKEYFRSTELFAAIRDWEKRNPTFTILG